MTPAEHAREAERLLDQAERFYEASVWRQEIYLRAQVHATLALRTPATTPRKKTNG